MANSVNPSVVSGGINDNRNVNSLYSSVDFDFKNQLYLTTTLRGDWSSTLTYANGFSTSTYSTILSLSSAMSVMAGLLMKAKPLQTANNIQMYVKLLIITGLFFCAYSLIRQQTTLIVVSLLFNFVNSMALIFMTTIINQHIAFSSGLLRFYALVEGGIITVFYLINISANFVVNLLLKIDVAYQLLYLINGGLLIISSIVIYLCFSKRSQSFPRSIINRENY